MAIIKRTAAEPAETEQRQRSRDIQGLLTELADPSPSSRRWAARDLAEFPDAAAALVARLAEEDDRSVREAILVSLTTIGNGAAVGGLVECLRSEDAALRNEAIEAMKNLPDAVAPIMSALLADPEPDVRIFAVNVLESLRHPDVEKWLIEVITGDGHVNVCATAVDLLVEVGGELALGPLETLKHRFPDEPYIEFAANLALKRIRGE